MTLSISNKSPLTLLLWDSCNKDFAMIHYFIDFENVHEAGFVGIETINEPTVIHVIYSEAANKLPLKLFSAASSLLVSWTFELANNGAHDALDIQLGVYLGLSIAKCPDDTFYVVSADKGYDSAIASLIQKGFAISRQLNIKGDQSLYEIVPTVLATQEPKNPVVLDGVGQQIRKLIPEELCDNDKIAQISVLITSASKLIDVYRGVVKIAGGFQHGGQTYGCIKAYVNDYFENKSKKTESQKKKTEKVTSVQLRQYLTVQECSDKTLKSIVNIINNTTKLQQVSPQINKALGNDAKKGSAIYKKIKPLVKTLY